MADWFKWYEDELDSPAFSAAWSECSYLPSVLLWVRTEATKQKSDRFRVSGKYFLIGLAQKLKITEHDLKRALNLLKEINYIDIQEDFIIIVNNWEKHQSKYLYERSRKLNKQLEASQDVPTQYPHNTHSQTRNYSECTLRGEEIREDKKRGEETKKTSPPNLKNKEIENFYKEIYSIFVSKGIKLLKKSESLELLFLALKRHNQEAIKESLHLVLNDSKINTKYLHPFGLINFLERIETFVSPKPNLIYKEAEIIKPLTDEERLKALEAKAKLKKLMEQKDLFKSL